MCFDSWDNNLQYRIILPSHLFFSHGFTILCLLVKIKPDMLSWGQWFYCELLSWSWAGSEFPTSLFEQFFHAGRKGGGYSGTCRSMPYKSALRHGTCEYDIVGSFLSLSFSLRLEMSCSFECCIVCLSRSFVDVHICHGLTTVTRSCLVRACSWMMTCSVCLLNMMPSLQGLHYHLNLLHWGT